jgi:hypothetical protein
MSNDNLIASAAARPQVQDRKVARINAAAEQRRLDAAARTDDRARQHELEVQRRRDALTLRRESRTLKQQERRQRHAGRLQARARLAARVRTAAPTVGRRVMIVGPILAPMAVAWIGQIGFALKILHWPLAGAVMFAAAWELTTADAQWMYHQARKAGDRGTLFRIATWTFAASAGAMNYWHALDGRAITDPTPKAVSFGVMSLVGIALWELYSSLTHRKALRARGIIPPARPRFGVARWLRYPRITWWAWSLTIRHGFTTTDQAWAAAVREVARRGPVCRRRKPHPGRAPIRVTAVWRGPKVVRQDGLTSWTALPVVWLPATGQTTPQITGPDHAPSVDRTTGQTTAVPAVETTPQTTDTATRRTTRRTTGRRGRRTREQLREQVGQMVSDIYAAGGEIKVQPIAKALRANRTTVRELLDEMHVRPMDRKEATG